ncbi:MAG: four helix bundle protein [Dysgonomonadaceae bacterium]|jgi:four helix bundle protein|nr:four helix bundle protein [Dysgonamonadaceae bacterium]HOT65264.1 four helix bundle protein [Dysgonamonadaceae bacterium]HOV35110.1 four helix bundle protein [Dysgonamonadaceae bacterium]HQG07662.1 four helix bundle protein [Dysgonamonadaceae bacterium]HQI43506.1 four helix bundle protein [Dysgonamonadaceae bacterium]
MISKENEIVKVSFDFAMQIVSYCESLEKNKRFIIANQLLKSGTSIGANVREAQNAESITDFLHKMKIAAKEVEETEYWLLICDNAKNYPPIADLLPTLNSIKKILAKIISSTKKKINESSNQ